MFDKEILKKSFENFSKQRPFSYCYIDDFFPKSLAQALSAEFPSFQDPKWHEYKNQIEISVNGNHAIIKGVGLDGYGIKITKQEIIK